MFRSFEFNPKFRWFILSLTLYAQRSAPQIFSPTSNPSRTASRAFRGFWASPIR
jgi:hypothetical protein